MIHHKRKHLIIKETRSYKQLDAEHILYIMCEDYLCAIHLTSGDVVHSTKSLSFFEDILFSHHFFRVNHHILINMAQIERIIVNGRSRVVLMKGGAKLPISVRKWPAFKDALHGGTLVAQNDTLASDNSTLTN